MQALRSVDGALHGAHGSLKAVLTRAQHTCVDRCATFISGAAAPFPVSWRAPSSKPETAREPRGAVGRALASFTCVLCAGWVLGGGRGGSPSLSAAVEVCLREDG